MATPIKNRVTGGKKKQGSGKKSAPAKKKGTGSFGLNEVGRQELARLRNIQANQYYVPGDQAYLRGLAKLVQNGKAPGSQDWKVRAGKATRNQLAMQAGKTVQAELNPMIGAAKNYESGLETLYGNLAKSQAATATQMKSDQAARTASIGQRYDQTASNIASNFRQGRESTTDELARLGLTGISGGVGQQLEQNAMSLASAGRQNALSQQDAGAQAFNQLQSLLSGETQTTGAELRAASSQKRGELEASRAGKVAALFKQFTDQSVAQQAEAAQQAFLNRITKSKLSASTDLSNAQALGALATARKNIVDSRRPSAKRVKKIG